MTYPIGQCPSPEARIATLRGNNDLLRRELRLATDAKGRAFWRGAVFGGIVIAALAFSLPAFAQDRMSLTPGTASCFAVVSIENRAGTYNADEALETIHGPVVLHYETIGGHNALDADEVSVVSLPDGVVAEPSFMALPDGETGRVCLLEWVGG
jgi:hypothetical protein